MSERVNKNGIRVLDLPGQNHLPKPGAYPRTCLPGRHRFRLRQDLSDGFHDVYVCSKCGERDVTTSWWGTDW